MTGPRRHRSGAVRPDHLPDERVLTAAQRRVLHQMGGFTLKRGFYMGGGTAVALYLGHRRSVDFDWFTPDALDDPLALAQALRESLQRSGAALETYGLEPGTLHGAVDGVNVSFLEYKYPLLQPLVEWANIPCRAASLDDLACMKLVAVVQRGTRKDFVDVYALGTAYWLDIGLRLVPKVRPATWIAGGRTTRPPRLSRRLRAGSSPRSSRRAAVV